MPLHDDGDLVRAYGFVAIRFASLEDVVDDCLRQIEPLLKQVEKRRPIGHVLRWQFSERVKALRKVFRWAKTNGLDFEHKDYELARAEKILCMCLKAAKKRNETLHSPIIADLRTGAVIRHPRDTGPYKVISKEVYELANGISNIESAVRGLGFTINSMLGRPRFS